MVMQRSIRGKLKLAIVAENCMSCSTRLSLHRCSCFNRPSLSEPVVERHLLLSVVLHELTLDAYRLHG